MKQIVYTLIIFLMPVWLGSCGSNSSLVKNRVVTNCVSDSQGYYWKETEARKKIFVKSFRVLVVNGVESSDDLPYGDALSPATLVNSPMSLDTTLRSGFYNRVALSALGEKVSTKDNWTVLVDFVPENELEKLRQTIGYDVVLILRGLDLHYHTSFYGKSVIRNMKQSNKEEIITDQGRFSPLGVYSLDHIVSEYSPVYFQIARYIPKSFISNTVIYRTKWDLHWLTSKEKENTTMYLEQEGLIRDANFFIDALLTSVAQEAGRSIVPVFAW